MRHSFPISELCKALGVSRSGYHAAIARVPGRRKEANAHLLIHMNSIHAGRYHPLLRKSQNDSRTPGPRPDLLGKSRRPPDALGRLAGQAQKAFPAKDHRGGGGE